MLFVLMCFSAMVDVVIAGMGFTLPHRALHASTALPKHGVTVVFLTFNVPVQGGGGSTHIHNFRVTLLVMLGVSHPVSRRQS